MKMENLSLAGKLSVQMDYVKSARLSIEAAFNGTYDSVGLIICDVETGGNIDLSGIVSRSDLQDLLEGALDKKYDDIARSIKSL